MRTKIFVDNLSLETSAQEIHDHFSRGGRAVASVTIVLDRESGQSRGFGFVEMAADVDSAALIGALDGVKLRGHALLVSEVDEEKGPPQSSGRPLGDFCGRW